MRPTPTLCARLRFSTKDVGKGFYRGNRTGSLGAHTAKGGYLIDYRKVRNYNVPDFKDFQLTPFVTREIGEKEVPEEPSLRHEDEYDTVSENFKAQDLSLARRKRAMKFIEEWKRSNPQQFEEYENYQVNQSLREEIERAQKGEKVELLERLRSAARQESSDESATYGS